GWTGCEHVLAHRFFHAVEIIADQERLAGARDIMDFISCVPLPGRRAFEVGDEGRPSSRQVVVVSQGRSPAREAMPMRLVVLPPSRSAWKVTMRRIAARNRRTVDDDLIKFENNIIIAE